MKDFGTSESPKSTRSSTTHWCPGRPGHPAFRHNIASSLRLHTGLPYDWTPRSDAPLGSPLAPSARRVSRVASRLPGTTRLRFALHGWQRKFEDAEGRILLTDNPRVARGMSLLKRFRFSYAEPQSGGRAPALPRLKKRIHQLSPYINTVAQRHAVFVKIVVTFFTQPMPYCRVPRVNRRHAQD